MKYCLDIGCGTSLQPDTEDELWFGIDQAKSDDKRIWQGDICDVLVEIADKQLYGYPATAFDHIKAHQVLEHIRQYDYIQVWNYMWDILKPEGTLHITVPRYGTNAAVQDPTHVRFFVPESFQYFCDDGSGKTAFDGLSENYGVRTLFKMIYNNFHEESIIYDVKLKK